MDYASSLADHRRAQAFCSPTNQPTESEQTVIDEMRYRLGRIISRLGCVATSQESFWSRMTGEPQPGEVCAAPSTPVVGALRSVGDKLQTVELTIDRLEAMVVRLDRIG